MKSCRWITVLQNNPMPLPPVLKWLDLRSRQVTLEGRQGIYELRTREEGRNTLPCPDQQIQHAASQAALSDQL